MNDQTPDETTDTASDELAALVETISACRFDIEDFLNEHGQVVVEDEYVIETGLTLGAIAALHAAMLKATTEEAPDAD